MANGRKTGGRKKGVPNKLTGQLKEMILQAVELAGNDMSENGQGGTVQYLRKQATLNPTAFMSLLGRVLPLQIGGDPGNPVELRNVGARDLIAERISGLVKRESEEQHPSKLN